MNIDKLRTLTKNTVLAIERIGPEGIKGIEETVAPVRAALAERGLAPGCHVGVGRELAPDEVVEWYAGQLLSIVDKKGWFAMNTLLNLLDQFCGPR